MPLCSARLPECRATARLLVGLGKTIGRRWREPDEGIWERRGGPRQHTDSRVMCRVGLDRLLRFQEEGHLEGPREAFSAERRAIRDEVERRGYNGRATGLWGAALGTVHCLFVLGALLRIFPAVHPRMATERRGPEPTRALEPPGFMALNYGRNTPLTTLLAHLLYGAILGAFYGLGA